MPVEIKELIVRAIVTDPRAEAGAGAAPRGELTEDAREALVEACVREVLKVLKRSSER